MLCSICSAVISVCLVDVLVGLVGFPAAAVGAAPGTEPAMDSWRPVTSPPVRRCEEILQGDPMVRRQLICEGFRWGSLAISEDL